MKGVIFDIKRFALHDGPGIRTTVFFKGCPLRCRWCHNPESWNFEPETFAGADGKSMDVGREVGVEDVLEEVLRDQPFYEESGGGVTFSGGEPLAQPEFLMALLKKCRDAGLHCTVDTCGYADPDLLKEVAGFTDFFLYDIKLMDDEAHRQYTGVEGKLIRDNLEMLCALGANVQIRVPLVPGITDTSENLNAIRTLAKRLPGDVSVRELAFHRLAADKYRRFGMAVPDVFTV